jgi:hypothetical protein
MALKQLGKSRAMPAVAVLIAAGKATSGLPWALAISLMLAPFILLRVLIFITAIFGDKSFSDRAFRLICLPRDRQSHRLRSGLIAVGN